MILGRVAVGAIIFAVVLYLLFNLPNWVSEGDDELIAFCSVVMLVLSLYCAISGTYLLYLGGKI